MKNMNHAVEHNDDDDDDDDDVYDSLLSAELLLPNESSDGFIHGTVIKQAKDNLGAAYIHMSC